MLGLILFVLLIGVPIAELYVIVQLGQEIGILQTLALMFVMSAAGAALLKQQGTATWRRLQATIQQGGIPAAEATDGALIVLGGALLLTPGFLSDIVGILLLLPPTRVVFKKAARKFFAKRAGRVLDVRYVKNREL